MPHRKRAGIVKMVPVARAVEAEPIVCERFASRMVLFAPNRRKTATVSTAAGMEAETVIPTRNPRYALAAPNTIPSTTPAATALSVNSARGSVGVPLRMVSSAGIHLVLLDAGEHPVELPRGDAGATVLAAARLVHRKRGPA